MKGFVQNLEGVAVKNVEFRRVLYTAKSCQLVVMALKPKEEIGAEVHKLDQFFRVEEGTGEAVLDGVRTVIRAGFAVLVPAGTNHNIVNTGSVPLKLYTLYARRIIGTALSTIPAPKQRRTTNISMVIRRNRESTAPSKVGFLLRFCIRFAVLSFSFGGTFVPVVPGAALGVTVRQLHVRIGSGYPLWLQALPVSLFAGPWQIFFLFAMVRTGRKTGGKGRREFVGSPGSSVGDPGRSCLVRRPSERGAGVRAPRGSREARLAAPRHPAPDGYLYHGRPNLAASYCVRRGLEAAPVLHEPWPRETIHGPTSSSGGMVAPCSSSTRWIAAAFRGERAWLPSLSTS